MRSAAIYHKGTAVRYTSHLDVQRMLQRSFRRAALPLAFSQGFNPHPQISFATALSTGMTGDAEWFDVTLTEPMETDVFMRRVNASMPTGFSVSDAFVVPEGFGSLSAKLAAAQYEAALTFDRAIAPETLQAALDELLSGEIIVNKRTKSGVRAVDIRPEIRKVIVTGIEGKRATLLILGKLQADGGLRVELLLDTLLDRLDANASADIRRTDVFFASDGLLPRLPTD